MFIEDYIEQIGGLSTNKFLIESKDQKLLKSLATQVSKKIPFTDRQFALAKSKLQEYKQQFFEKGYNNFLTDIEKLKMPLRQIDRSKTITLVHKEYFDLFGVHKKIMLAIRFPYSKKMIKYIQAIHAIQEKQNYDATTKTHFVDFNENNVFYIISKFKDANFEIDEKILNYANTLIEYTNNKEKFIPGIYNFQIKNVNKHAYNFMLKFLGEPNNHNLTQYYDRRNLFGLGYFDSDKLKQSTELYNELAQKIAKSINHQILVVREKYSFQMLYDSLWSLKRFPILVILKDGYETSDLLETIEHTKNFISSQSISVLFRLENDNEKNILFNKTVQDYNLNNIITENTKIVFINSHRIPKPLIASRWKPSTSILMESFRHNKKTDSFYKLAELVVHYDNVKSTWIPEANQIETL